MSWLPILHSRRWFPLAGMVLLLVGGCHAFDPPDAVPVAPVAAAGVPAAGQGGYAAPGMVAPGVIAPGMVAPMGSMSPTLVPDPSLAPYGYAYPGGMATPPATMAGGTGLASGVGIPVADQTVALVPNPLKVPVPNHDYAWDQIVDVVSDYFPIQSEQRVLLTGASWTEGRIETPYQSGATIFEPHRKDTVGTFNHWKTTLQTIRRRAVVRVLPQTDGYLVDLRVDKELEDLAQPEQSTAGAATFRNDNSLPAVGREEVNRFQSSPYWISLGRDVALEQQMLTDIRDRLANVPAIPMSVAPTQ